MNRNQLLTVLKINGLDASAPDDEIRALLLNAKYSAHEVESALHILRDSKAIENPRVDGLHRVFFTDDNLKPNEISTLLGVEVNLDLPVKRWTREQSLSTKEVWIIISGSILIAVLTIVTYMFVADVGYFYVAEV